MKKSETSQKSIFLIRKNILDYIFRSGAAFWHPYTLHRPILQSSRLLTRSDLCFGQDISKGFQFRAIRKFLR